MNAIPTRSEVPAQDAWDLSALYASPKDWEEDLQKLSGYEEKLTGFAGRLAESPATLAEYLNLTVECGILDERLGYYAMLRQSEDAGDSENQGRVARYMQVASRLGAAMSFFAPELQQIPEKAMNAYLEDPEVAPFSISLNKILRYRPHTLTPAEERLLAMQEEANQTAQKSFAALVDVDMDFGEVETPEGPRPLSQSTFGSLLEHRDRDVRARTFHQFYRTFEQHRNTLAALLSGSVQLDIYRARVRGFNSALEARLFPDRVPEGVYDNLVDTVRENLPLLHRYYDLRKQILGLEDLEVYDTRVSLVETVKTDIPYETAVDSVVQALAPLGEEYTETLRSGLLGGWVDRFENHGKRSGAFSAGSYVGEPYILMNYKSDTIRDMFTLAHEGGHSMHSWYSVRNNPFQHYNYTIFEAEVASTFNEQLLTRHLLANHETGPMRAYLISKHLDDMVGTLFRQTMFAEYERTIHRMVEEGNALTVDSLRAAYQELISAYFGDGVTLPEELSLEGMRIPHFYRAFYVYKYATGISAAITLSRRVLEGSTREREQYFSFLKSGGSRFPIESLRAAGVDMEQPEAVNTAMALFSTRLDQLEQALVS